MTDNKRVNTAEIRKIVPILRRNCFNEFAKALLLLCDELDELRKKDDQSPLSALKVVFTKKAETSEYRDGTNQYRAGLIDAYLDAKNICFAISSFSDFDVDKIMIQIDDLKRREETTDETTTDNANDGKR